ncbi:hypothetical protein GCM10023235_76000 [Kitasatospora terrestris]|uniref:Major facilitator superfamily (MFS) profile domain-containing protein n=1 Tax=Kitasatospora terrestris TaxID=258051 RepID=A0ABP9ES11_9ACTN
MTVWKRTVAGVTAEATATGEVSGVRRPSEPARLVSVLLTVVAVMCVLLPGLQGAAAPHAAVELGVGPARAGIGQVLGVLVVVAGLFAAGPAADLFGARRVLSWSLTSLCAGGLLLVAAFDPWSFNLARVLVGMAVSATFVVCLASVPERHLPGRIGRVVGGVLAAMGLAFFAVSNLAARLVDQVGWRALAAVVPLVAAGLALAVRRFLPPADAPRARPAEVAAFTAVMLPAVALTVAALQLGPARGWADPWVLAAETAGPALAVAGFAALRASARRRPRAWRVPVPETLSATAAAVALGFTEVVLVLAVPALTTAAGAPPWQGLLAVSAFGLGTAAAGLLAARRGVSRVAAASLGLPLAAVGMVLLHALPSGATAATAVAGVIAALVGFGLMLAQVPQATEFLAALPRQCRTTMCGLYPVALLLGTAAAAAVPHASTVLATAGHAGVHELIWVGTVVAGAAALALGKRTVVLAVAGAAGVQYLLLRGLAGADHADRPWAIASVMAIGLAAGAAAWIRVRQADRLATSRASATALQRAVLRDVPPRLGDLRLASLYEPATADTGIGGDFYEALHTPYGARILLGDVRGKGLQAVQTVTDLLGCFRSQVHETPDLGELAARLDRQLVRAAVTREDEELFATALILELRDGDDQLAVINCGHLAPLAVTPASTSELAVPALLPLGFGVLGDRAAPAPARIPLPAGTTLLLHTDGLSEARNASGEFYPLTERLAHAPSAAPDDLVRFLTADARQWTHQLGDDIAIIALDRRPAR